MNNSRVIYFLNLLERNTTGHEEEIDNLSIKAINEDERVTRLKGLLTDYHFIPGLGENLKIEAENALKDLQTNPDNYQEIFIRIEQSCLKISAEIRNTEILMNSAGPFSQPILVVSKKDYPIYVAMLKRLVNSSVYLLVLYGGCETVTYFHWNEAAALRELLSELNSRYLPAIMKLNPPEYGWTITKKHLGGDAIFGGSAFFIKYEPYEEIEIRSRFLHKEPLGPNFFLNVDAYENDDNNVPYCWGRGNVLSFNQDNAVRACIQSNPATELRAPVPQELIGKMPTPMELARRLANGREFCITADQLLCAMNQWYVGTEIDNRRREGKCLICGKKTGPSALICKSHFSSRGRN